MKKDSDPTELVSCGKCTNVNTVPFGLDKFKCYSSQSLVLVAREPSSSCAAASSTALYYNELEATKNSTAPTRATSASSLGSDSLTLEAPKKEKEPTGFFGKLQQKMDKTIQKVDKTFLNLTSSKPTVPETAPPSVQPSAVKPPAPLPNVNSEEEQLQWALNASLTESRNPQHLVSETTPPVMMGRPPNVAASGAVPSGLPTSTNPGDQLQAAATHVAQKLQGSEERAAIAEKELAKALERENTSVAQIEELKRQLDDNEGVIRGLTQQIDVANAELEARVKHCLALEDALVQAQQMAARAADTLTGEDVEDNERAELDRQGTVAQLLARITELENRLLQATHFAPEENGEISSPKLLPPSMVEEESSACAVAVDESQSIAKLVEVSSPLVGTCVAQLPSETVAVVNTENKPVVISSPQESISIAAENSVLTPAPAIEEAVVTNDTLASLEGLVFNPPPRSESPEKQADSIQPNDVNSASSGNATSEIQTFGSTDQLGDTTAKDVQEPSIAKEVQELSGQEASS